MSEPPTDGGPAASRRDASSNVYHKEARPLRSRYRHVELLDAAVPRTSRAPAGKPDPLRDYFRQHLKTLAFVVLGMLILVGASIKVLNAVWGMKERRAIGKPKTSAEARTEKAGAAAAAKGPELLAGIPAVTSAVSELEPSRRASFLAQMGKAFEQSGRTDEAIRHYGKALEEWPEMPDVWASLGRLYLRQNDYTNALQSLQAAADRNPSSAELLNDLGVVCLRLGDAGRALTNLAAAMDLDAEYAPTYYNQALAYVAKGQREAADEALTRYLALRPSDARGLREKASLAAMSAKYLESLGILRQAIEAKPDWALLYFDAATVSALHGDAAAALDYLLKAEPLTSPGVVYRVYRQPTFRALHLSEEGKRFEADLARRAKKRMAGADPTLMPGAALEPMASDKAAGRGAGGGDP